jgi:hypothetical protein
MHVQEESFTFMNFELYKIGSRSVTISYRSKPTKSDWPPEIDEVLSRLSNAWKPAPRTAKVDKENPLIRSSCALASSSSFHSYPTIWDSNPPSMATSAVQRCAVFIAAEARMHGDAELLLHAHPLRSARVVHPLRHPRLSKAAWYVNRFPRS